jgi:hypothetical protein
MSRAKYLTSSIARGETLRAKYGLHEVHVKGSKRGSWKSVIVIHYNVMQMRAQQSPQEVHYLHVKHAEPNMGKGH